MTIKIKITKEVVRDYDGGSGDDNLVGVRAVAECLIPHNEGAIYQRIESPGTWGIELSNLEETYVEETYVEEIKILMDMLFAFSARKFDITISDGRKPPRGNKRGWTDFLTGESA